jgi:ABC-2 type transport system ATP-binding protein
MSSVPLDDLVIDAVDVTKSFGSTRALTGLTLRVHRGEVHGFLGPNGAGKTTMLRALLGLLRIDGGTMRLLDGDPWRDAVSLHARVAYVPGDVTLWPNLTGGEVIELLASVRGPELPGRRDQLIELFDLDPTKRCRAYSRGNRQKVALIAALAADVDLYLLDEPTSGLDPLKEAAFRDVIGELRDEGRTVLLSSHILSEAEALSDRVTIIRDGRTVESGRIEELRHLSHTTVTAELASVPDDLGRLPGVHGLSVDGHTISARVDADAMEAFMRHLGNAGILRLVSQPPTLEELFLRHYDQTGPDG